MPKLLSQSKHEEFEPNSALQIRDYKERIVENAKKLELQENLAGHEIFTGCTVHPAKFSSYALFMPPAHCSLLTHCSCCPFEVLIFVPLFDFSHFVLVNN